MFMGEFSPARDDKGRIAVPVKLRRAFGDGELNRLVATHGFDRCVMAFRETDWTAFVENTLLKLSPADPLNRKRLRFLLGGAALLDLDRQGRILLPAHLTDYASIQGDVLMVGLYNRIEIWSPEKYAGQRPDDAETDLFASEIGW